MRFRNHIYQSNFTFSTSLPGHVDIPRLEAGKVGAVFWSVFTPCPGWGSDDPKYTDPSFPDTVYHESIHDTLQQIDIVHRLAEEYPSHLVLTGSSRGVREIHSTWKKKKKNSKKTRKSARDEAVSNPRPIASVLGVEGLHQIGNSPAVLRLYHRLGVRYITLTHMCNNRYADGALAPGGPVWGGLSPAGRDMIKEMNRVGMMVDLSHTTEQTMRQALEITRAPVVYSHSGAWAVCPHERNVRDGVLEMVKANGGVVQVVFAPGFVKCMFSLSPFSFFFSNLHPSGGPNDDGKEATLSDVADHILHIATTIGWEHVGLGSDFDGIQATPQGLEHIGKYPDLLKELLRRGAKDEELEALVGGNLLRVWEEVERVAEEMKDEGRPVLEDDVVWP